MTSLGKILLNFAVSCLWSKQDKDVPTVWISLVLLYKVSTTCTIVYSFFIYNLTYVQNFVTANPSYTSGEYVTPFLRDLLDFDLLSAFFPVLITI